MSEPAQPSVAAAGAATSAPELSGGPGRAGAEAVALRPEVGPVDTSSPTEVAIRLLDLLGALFALVLLAPVFALVALAVRIDSGGPAIFRQRRLGRGLEPFSVAKFRTMHESADVGAHRAHVEQMIDAEEGGAQPMTKLQEDARVTRVGAFLRRTSLDELPQLWNVLRGEMSLVGPRPPIQYEVDRYPAKAFRRFAVRPGLTGLWQVRGRSTVTFHQMIALDTEYVERRSLGLYLKILLLTPPTVLHGKGAA